jgi:Amt family ammonium transporter
MSPAWFLACGLGALLLRLGMSIHAAGMVRSKNSSSTLIRSITDICLTTLAFWAVGSAISISSRFLPDTNHLFSANSTFFFLCASLIASGIVTGVSAERSKFFPMCCASILVGALLVPITFRWNLGWLTARGFIDTGGASILHLTGGLTALIVAILIGPRNGKYNRDGSSNGIPGHSVPLASIGTMLILVGWIPTILGMTSFSLDNILLPASNILLAAAAGAIASLVLCHFRYGKPDIHLMYTGFLGALVAISASAHVTLNIWAVVIGAVAGILVPLAAINIDLRFKIDDPTSGIAIHAVSSIWGLLAAALFTSGLTPARRLPQVGIQLLGIASIAALTILLSLALFLILKRTIGLRAREADEFDGLDLAEHDIGAYPDFQQTTIKSYHLREA